LAVIVLAKYSDTALLVSADEFNLYYNLNCKENQISVIFVFKKSLFILQEGLTIVS